MPPVPVDRIHREIVLGARLPQLYAEVGFQGGTPGERSTGRRGTFLHPPLASSSRRRQSTPGRRATWHPERTPRAPGGRSEHDHARWILGRGDGLPSLAL